MKLASETEELIYVCNGYVDGAICRGQMHLLAGGYLRCEICGRTCSPRDECLTRTKTFTE
jgi:hypothetical protein